MREEYINMGESIECECGSIYQKAQNRTHKRTTKHKEFFAKSAEDAKKVKCECGLRLQKENLKGHLATKKHEERLLLNLIKE